MKEAVSQGYSVTLLYWKYHPMSKEISSYSKKLQPHWGEWEERDK